MDELQLFISRIEDLIDRNEYSDNNYLGFLNEREAATACSYLSNRRIPYKLYGGYENADRVFISLKSDESFSMYPITAVLISSKGKRTLSHRDYLGSLMGIGIKRECIGDIILLSDNKAVVFLRNDIVIYVTNELSKVANENVTVCEYYGDTNSFSKRTSEENILVTSMRIDNVISAFLNCSRSQTADLISEKRVFVNYYQVTKASTTLSESDVVSIRGKGKFIVGKQEGKTKRERIILSVMRYV